MDKKNVVSYSLWGDNPFYTEGAVHNLKLVKKYYPEWVCRFYLEKESVPEDVLERLITGGAEIVYKCNNDNTSGMMWRFEVMFDNDVDRFMIRDTDSRIFLREKLAVDQWIESGKSFHVMRDNPAHNIGILGGMWGGRVDACKVFKEQYYAWINNPNSNKKHGADQQFLTKVLWNTVRNDMLCHDRCKNYRPVLTGDELDFPLELVGNYFVGGATHATDSLEGVYEDHVRNSGDK